MGTITIGVDLAELVFAVCELDENGRVLQRKELRRDAFAVWLAQVPAGMVVAMEACSGAHHWARRCLGHGLQPKLIAAQFVTPFRKSRTTKNDRNDAEAIATAATVGSAQEFKNGRQLAAWLGLTPTQHSSGGRSRLGTIS